MGNNTKKVRESDSKNDNVILDNNDGSYLNVDWDTIEKNYRNRHRHRHSHSNSSVSKQSDTKTTVSDKHNSEFSKHTSKGASSHHKKKKLSRKQKIIITLISIPIILIIILLSLFGIFHYMGKSQLLNYDNAKITFPEDIDYENNGKTVTYDGHTYAFNQNIASILFMGIDNRELIENNFTSTDGLADALYVLTYDTSNGNMKILSLNRDTITEVIRYDTAGKYHDTVQEQLCMAYGYGNGKETSAENQVISVERLLYNIPINAYYAINLSAIKTLNDDIGGVTVTPEYTFGSFTKGQQITIQGDLAEEFVRHRDTNLLDDNLRRISCQKLYINAFANQIVPAIRNDFSIPMKLYQDTQENTVTNMNISTLTFLASSLATNFKGVNIVSIDGKYKKVKGDASAEFVVDKEDLLKKILDIYYTQIN